MKRLTLLLGIMLIIASCGNSSQSGRAAEFERTVPLEKVVIIEGSATAIINGQYRYKVKRIDKGVTAYAYDLHYYTPGDTIFKRFENR